MKRFYTLIFVLCLAVMAAPAFAEAININKADAKTLATGIKGIGMKKAEAIVAYRKAHGPFKTVDELTMVKGIGAKTVDNNRKSMRVMEPAAKK